MKAREILWQVNDKRKAYPTGASVEFLSELEISQVLRFHRSFANYAPTPLRRLSHLAAYLGVTDVFVKDESFRFGLNAFKVLGGSYAIGKYLAGRLGIDIQELSFEKLRSPELKKKLGDITFTTATDGNHGRGVAWAAQQLGQKAVIYMPKGSSQTRLENILATGAEASITEFNYDDAVRLAAEMAQKHGWVMVQDTAWPGYEAIPKWIMQGYATMAAESVAQLQCLMVDKPTHIFLQAGVGSLAGAMQGYFTAVFGQERPVSAIVEPHAANCIYKSALNPEGMLQVVSGELNTIMAGLACGEPNTIAWDILRDYSDMMISCPDEVAARGMRILGNPLADDPRVVSGESGAVTLGIVSLLCQDRDLQQVKSKLGLNESSKILVFNTEGDTDPENYRRIVWDGAFCN